MLISDYLSSNIKICIPFCDFTHFKKTRARRNREIFLVGFWFK